MNIIKKIGLILFAASLMGMTAAPAQAAMVATDSVIAAEQSQFDRGQLMAALQREEIKDQLVLMGVDTSAAMERVARLTDAEVTELNTRLAGMPAGGDGTGIALLVIVVLLIMNQKRKNRFFSIRLRLEGVCVK